MSFPQTAIPFCSAQQVAAPSDLPAEHVVKGANFPTLGSTLLTKQIPVSETPLVSGQSFSTVYIYRSDIAAKDKTIRKFCSYHNFGYFSYEYCILCQPCRARREKLIDFKMFLNIVKKDKQYTKKERESLIKKEAEHFEFEQWKEENIVFINMPIVPEEDLPKYTWPKLKKDVPKIKMCNVSRGRNPVTKQIKKFPTWVSETYTRLQWKFEKTAKTAVTLKRYVRQMVDENSSCIIKTQEQLVAWCKDELTKQNIEASFDYGKYVDHLSEYEDPEMIPLFTYTRYNAELKAFNMLYCQKFVIPEGETLTDFVVRVTKKYMNKLPSTFEIEQFLLEKKAYITNEAKMAMSKIKSKLAQFKDDAKPFVEATKSKLKNLTDKTMEQCGIFSTFLSSLPVPDLDQVYEILDNLKPMNFFNLIGQMANAQSTAEYNAYIICLCELYGIFWTSELNVMKHILINLISRLTSSLLELYWTPARSAQRVFIQQAKINVEESTCIQEVCRFFEIDPPKEVDDFGLKIFGGIIAVFCIITGGKITKLTQFTTKKFFKNIKEFSSNIKSIGNLIDGLPKVWTFILTEVSSWFGMTYETSASAAVNNFKDELLKFRTEVHDLAEVMKTKPQDLLMDQARLIKAKTAMQRLDGLYDKLLRQKENMASTKGVFDDIKNSMKTIEDFTSAMDSTTCRKIEPFVVMLGGKPGIGKSQFLEWFMKRFMEKLKERFPEEEHRQNTCYSRNSTEAYWSGYAGHTFVMFDDFGQIKLDTDHADLMLVKNPNKTILPMADIPGKGSLFSSIGILCASNQPEPTSSNVVKCSAALTRRMEINVLVCDPKFDEFVAEHGMSPGNFHKTRNQTPMTTNTNGVEIPYFDPDYAHLNFFVNGIDAHNNIKKRITPEEIVDTALNYYSVYKEQYVASLMPRITVEVPDDVSEASAPENRVSVTIDEAQESFENDRVTSAAADKLRRLDFNAKVDFAVTPVLEPEEEDFGSLIPNMEYVRRPKNPPRMTRHQLDEVESTSTSFQSYDVKRGTVICIQGDPGTGKSVLMEQIQQEVDMQCCHGNEMATFAIRKPVVYIEDATISEGAFEQVRKYVMQIYDGKSPIQKLIMTINPEIADKYLEAYPEEQRIAFWRRCERYHFKFNIKKKSRLMWKDDILYNTRDMQNGTSHAIAVQIKNISYGLEKPAVISSTTLREELLKHCRDISNEQFSQIVTRTVPYMGRNQYTPNFVLNLQAPMYDWFKTMYENPSSITRYLVEGKVKFVKGHYLEGYRIASQFTGLSNKERIKFPETLDEFIVLINNSEFTSELTFCTELNCSDYSVVIMPKCNNPKRILCFKVCEYLTVQDYKISDGQHTRDTNAATQNVYNEFASTASKVAEQLEKATENIERDAHITIGFKKIEVGYPLLYSTIKLAIFAFKLMVAGLSIMTIVDAAKDRYQQQPRKKFFFQEGKKNSRTHRKVAVQKIKQKMKGRFDQNFYDNTKKFIDAYGTTAAKQRNVARLIDDFFSIGHSEDDFNQDTFGDFVAHYDEDDYLQEESREVELPTIPRLDVIPGLTIESREFETPLQPTVSAIPSLIIESENKTTPSGSTGDPFKMLLNTYTQEAVADQACVDIARKCARNTIELGKLVEGKFQRLVYGLMIGDRIGASVSHFVDPDQTSYARAPSLLPDKVFPITILKNHPGLDLCIFEIKSKNIPAFKDLRSHLMPDPKGLKTDFRGRRALLVTTESKDNFHEIYYRNVALREITEVMTESATKENPKKITALTYNGIMCETYKAGIHFENAPVLTQGGDCGSVLLVNDATLPKKLIGLHNAADNSEGCSTLLFASYFEKYFVMKQEMKTTRRSISPKIHNIPYVKETDRALMGMPIIAEIKEPPSMPTQTKFWDSPLALPGVNPFQPSVLSIYDTRNVTKKHPLYDSVAQWNHPQPQMNTEHMEQVAEDLAVKYANEFKKHSKFSKILTKTESVNASSQFEFKGLNRDSSPGYPWKKMFPKVGNFLYVKDTPQGAYYAIDESHTEGRKLSLSIDNLLEICRTSDQYPNVAFMANCKDEPIKVTKVYDTNTRTFAGSPLDFTILSRMYFGTLIGGMQSVRRDMPIKIGINPTSLEWDFMVKNFLEVSDIGTDADFSGWDKTVPHQFKEFGLPKFYNTLARLTNPDWEPIHDTIRTNIIHAEKNPRLLIPYEDRQFVVVAPGGQCSGSQRTAPDNSIVQLIGIRMAWDDICIKMGYPYLACQSSFDKFVCPAIYGDDGNYAIHPTVIDFFNFSSISAWFSKIGMKCTPASKDGQIVDWMPILDFEFLKRNSKKIGNHYYGCLQKKVFHKTLGYCLGPAHHYYNEKRGTPIKSSDLIQTARSALDEAIFHGPEYYNEILQHVQSCLARVGIVESFPRYKDAIVANSLSLPRS